MYPCLNIATLVRDTDPTLLHFNKQLTYSGCESRRKLFDTEVVDAKMIRHFYIVHSYFSFYLMPTMSVVLLSTLCLPTQFCVMGEMRYLYSS